MLIITSIYSYLIATNQTNLDSILNPFEGYTIPLADWVTSFINFLVENFRPVFQTISFPIDWTLEKIQWIFLSIPPLIFLIVIAMIAWQLAGKKIGIYTTIALTIIGFMGAWDQAMTSLSLIVTAVTFCLLLGIPIGILCANNKRVEKFLQPLLDAMQTLPTFVYLVPIVMLFGIGEVSGTIATLIFAVPPLIRLTNLGIRNVSGEVVEAAYAFGSTPWQILWEVQLPLATPTILAGINQAILLALSMSVVTSMIGVEGLGLMVLRGLGQLNVGLAFVGGLSIVLIAVMLDRITNVVGGKNSKISWQDRGPIGLLNSQFKSINKSIAIFLGFILVLSILGIILPAQLTRNQVQIQSDNLPGIGKTVQSARGSLLEEEFQTEIVNHALRKLGYTVPEATQIEYVTMHLALSNGELDYTPVHWEEGHQSFFENSGGSEKLEKIGVITPNLLQGYQIDKKTADKYNITNLGQLKDPKIAKIFDSDGDGKANLVGCNSGWGCEFVLDHHIEAYGLEDTVEHDRGNYSALIADALTRYQQGESILFYTWTPFWMASVLKPDEDVVWLEVPFTSLPGDREYTAEYTSIDGRNHGFAIDRMRFLVNKEFIEDNPAVRRLFELITIPIEDINAQNQLIQNGENSIEEVKSHAQDWIKKNQTTFDQWIAEAKKAAQ